MKSIASSLLMCTFLLGAAVPAFSDDYPSRKAGLWEMKIMHKGGPNQAPPTLQCIDQGTDLALQKMGEGMSGGACSSHSMKKEGANYVGDSVCTIMGSKITSHSIISGDFSNTYKAEVTAKYDPPLMGKSEAVTSVDAKYVGDCKPGQEPGDMILPNGTKMNVFKLMPAMRPGMK